MLRLTHKRRVALAIMTGSVREERAPNQTRIVELSSVLRKRLIRERPFRGGFADTPRPAEISPADELLHLQRIETRLRELSYLTLPVSPGTA